MRVEGRPNEARKEIVTGVSSMTRGRAHAIKFEKVHLLRRNEDDSMTAWPPQWARGRNDRVAALRARARAPPSLPTVRGE